MKYIFILFATLAPLANAHAVEPGDHPLNPLGDTSGGAPELYGRLIRASLGVIGVAALLFFIVGGFILLTSRGNPEKVKAGRDTLMWAAIGLFVAFTSYVLLRFVIETIITRT